MAAPPTETADAGQAGGAELPALLRWLGDKSEPTTLAVLLAANLALTLAAALSSDSVFQIDEYFQVIEFASHKLGITPGEALPWEFAARMRPWTQPGFYYALARGAMAAGVDDPFVLARVFRVASGLVAWSALATLVFAVRSWFPRRPWRSAMVASLTLAYYAPYLAARTSSESASSSFLVLGLALLAVVHEADGGVRARSSLRFLAAGVALGLSFECRYQAALAIAGMVLWLVLHGPDRGRRVALVVLGLLAPIALAFLIDAWGYGVFEFVPWTYLRINVLEGKAAVFGTLPFYAYAGMFLLTFPPFGAMILLGMLVFWWRFPRHLLTWLTLPFVVGHSLIGHKEFRFMFPMLVPGALCLLLLWSQPEAIPGRMAAVVRALRAVWFSRVTWGIDAVLVLVLCLLPSSDNFGLQRYFRQHAGEARWVGLTDPRRSHGAETPFLWPRPLPPVGIVASADELEKTVGASHEPVFVAAKFPLPEGAEAFLDRRSERVFASLPPFIARLDLFHWVDRADLTYVYRIEPGSR